jgi:sec-independent protein translocase protein TatB
MFGLGMGELILIAVVALLALGPDRLPDAAKRIGKTIRDLRRQTDQLKRTIEQDSQLGDAMKEIRSALRDNPLQDSPTKTPRKKTPPAATNKAAASGEKPAKEGKGDVVVEPADGAVSRSDEVAAADGAQAGAPGASEVAGEAGSAAEAPASPTAVASPGPVYINMSEYQRYVHMWGPSAAAEKYGTTVEEAEAAINAVVSGAEREPTDG